MPEPRTTITVEAARAAVLASGQLVALDGPYFLAAEDTDWLRTHFGAEPPLAAKVIITRRDQAPREIVIGWAEYEAQDQPDPEWNATRAAKPMTIFGSEVERHGYRVVFADVLAPLLTAVPAPVPADGPAPWETATEPPAVERDWRAEFEATTDVEALDALVKVARGARVFTPTPEGTALDIAWKAHRKALLADWTPAQDAWAEVSNTHAPVVAELHADGTVTDTRPATEPVPAEEPRRAAPQDHLPSNRADRRASARKKGRRR